MHEALDDPLVWKVTGCKSAQIAWTDGVILNYVGRRIDTDPCPMIIMFSKADAAKKFDLEKFTPMVEVTPCLAEKIPVHKARDRNNAWDHKGFPGGFLKFVGSNSPDAVKSTPAPVVIVEEPDDSNTNVRDQGDTITILEERTKTYSRRKVIYGGTPTIEGFSRVHAAYLASDQREFWVPCPHCGERQTLSWPNVRWTDDPAVSHQVYGHALVDSARYCCPHCGGLWTDGEKNRAVRQGEWKAKAPFTGEAGFAINELYSPFPGSTMPKLLEKYLKAEHALAQGDDTKMRSFRNNTEGLPYAYRSSVPDGDALRDRAEDYAELSIPWGGLVLTAGVDVQHDRLAVVIRAWGRGEESWLLYWGEIPGRTMVVAWNEDGSLNKEQSGAWWDLDQLLTGTFSHVSGAKLRIRAASVDSSDGQTQDAVYSYVRRRLTRGFMAIKGESHDPKKDIFSPPKLSVDTSGGKHKPHPSGVKPFLVGTQVAKDLMLGVDAQGGRIKLQGNGPGRMHWYRGVRPDYYDQITAEVKVPHKTIRGRLVWQCKAGRRNEGLDCEVYALHAARSLKLNLWREERWSAEEAAIKQPVLGFEEDRPATAPQQEGAEAGAEAEVQAPAPAAQAPKKTNTKPQTTTQQRPPGQSGGWSATSWRR